MYFAGTAVHNFLMAMQKDQTATRTTVSATLLQSSHPTAGPGLIDVRPVHGELRIQQTQGLILTLP
jgi:hypothetical protein